MEKKSIVLVFLQIEVFNCLKIFRYQSNCYLRFCLTGDVPNIVEITGNVNYTTNEVVKGIPSQNKFQFNVENSWSNLFDIKNDSVDVVILLLTLTN